MTISIDTKSQQGICQTTPKIGFVSLGCAKALVDSERIITGLKERGYEITPDYQDAEAVIINTCGFIDSAKAESFAAIKEAMAENGKVIVTGCLIAEKEKLKKDHPHLLAITGPQQTKEVLEAVEQHIPFARQDFIDLTPLPPGGIKLTPRHYAYLKISEGCNNQCRFCIIPDIRGPLKSRALTDILKEAEALAAAGVKELLIISQDTSAYGLDLKYEQASWQGEHYKTNIKTLSKLLGQLGIWVRLHYVYPYPHVDELIPLMKDGQLLPYLDIPFQHASPSVLKNMRRPAFADKTLERIKNWRKICPDLAIRSTFIVGYPGEQEDDFIYLLNWLEEAEIDRIGCFKYENVAGAKSRSLPDHVPQETIDERFARFMEKAQAISTKRLKSKIGLKVPVLIDELDAEGAIGRTIWDAPDVDGVIYLNGNNNVKPGDLVRVKITHSDEYDLWGKQMVSN